MGLAIRHLFHEFGELWGISVGQTFNLPSRSEPGYVKHFEFMSLQTKKVHANHLNVKCCRRFSSSASFLASSYAFPVTESPVYTSPFSGCNCPIFKVTLEACTAYMTVMTTDNHSRRFLSFYRNSNRANSAILLSRGFMCNYYMQLL